MTRETKSVHGAVATPAETATVLFALRFLQSNYDDSGIEDSVHFQGEPWKPCTENEIDHLCELINQNSVIL